MQGSKKDEVKFLAKSSKILCLTEENQMLKENEALENLRHSLKSQNEVLTEKVAEQEDTIQKMQECIDLNEGVLDNLRGTIDHDSLRIANLQIEVHQLKVDVKKKNKLISKLEKEAKEDCVMWDAASQEMVEKSKAIRNTRKLWRLLVRNLRPFLKMLRRR